MGTEQVESTMMMMMMMIQKGPLIFVSFSMKHTIKLRLHFMNKQNSKFFAVLLHVENKSFSGSIERQLLIIVMVWTKCLLAS